MGLFDKIRQALGPQKSEAESEFDRVIRDTHAEFLRIHQTEHYWGDDVNVTQVYKETVKPWPDEKKIAFLLWNVQECNKIRNQVTSWHSDNFETKKAFLMSSYVRSLMRGTLVMSDDDAVNIFDAFRDRHVIAWDRFSNWPVNGFVQQLIKQRQGKPLSAPIRALAEEMVKLINATHNKERSKELMKLLDKLEQFLYGSSAQDSAAKPVKFLGDDRLADFAHPMIEALSTEERTHWYAVLALAQKATGGKPSDKFLKEGKKLVNAMGADAFRQLMHALMEFLVTLKEEGRQREHTYADGSSYLFTEVEYITAINADAMKGLIWLTPIVQNGETLNLLLRLALRTYTKQPGWLPPAPSLGNACIYALYKSEGFEGIGKLSQLRLRIRYGSAEKLIDKYLSAAAQERGVSTDDIEDMSVDDQGLVNGNYQWTISDFTAVVSIEKVGKVNLQWFKPDGTPQKSVPTLVKEQYAGQLKMIKDKVKQVEQTLTVQRDRIDRMFRSDRRMPITHFETYYLNHGLMGWLARRIIWRFYKDDEVIADALWLKDQWVNRQGEQVNVSGADHVSLFHPVFVSTEEVRQWRELLMREQFLQPLKQAFREIYILTAAELTTRTYSNRMAAHLLRQHQFNSLAKGRGWRYALIGAYDNGMDFGRCTLHLPQVKMRVEFWINEIPMDNGWNDTGIYHYVGTDQVRFYPEGSTDPMTLVDVPKLVFSEAMRDVDLFVGVASVGNDPTWLDNGEMRNYRNYWEGYSFGDLTETGKTRREILAGLVPRLKIAPVAELRDKFLVVRGKLRTYKIHLGSTNILMEPNDQYLCIVPDRSAKDPTSNLFLPFEGDNALSIILSKAFLLADDDKITDETITRQIGSK